VADDLETAVDNSNAAILETQEKINTAVKAFAQALSQIEEAEQELEKAWEETKDKAEAFLKTVDNEGKSNEEESNSSRSALNELKAKILQGKSDYDEEIDNAQKSLDDFGEQNVKGLEDPIEAIMKMVGQTANDMEKEAGSILQNITKIATEAVSFFEGEISSALEENQRQVTERHNQLGDWITQQARPDMDTKHTDFFTKLKELETQTQSKFEETDQNSSTETKSVLDQCLGQHIQTIEQIMSLGQTLSTVLAGLSSSVATTGDTIGTVKQTVETCVETSNITVESIMGCFEKFQKICGGFSSL
jgi:tetratricopeptide (TPR) repeat protein